MKAIRQRDAAKVGRQLQLLAANAALRTKDATRSEDQALELLPQWLRPNARPGVHTVSSATHFKRLRNCARCLL